MDNKINLCSLLNGKLSYVRKYKYLISIKLNK